MKPQEKIIYEIDPHNRLIARKTGRVLRIPGYRQVLDGRFRVDKDNSLIYHVKRPSGLSVPQQIKLSGDYRLDNDRNLVLTLDKWTNRFQANTLTIKGELLDVKDNELSFAVSTLDSAGRSTVYILNFSGAWQADEYNRLTFNITKAKGRADIFTLEGGWQINENNEIIYTRAKSRLKTKEKITNAVTFKGRWDIIKRHRISYILNKEIKSQFDFEVYFGKLAKRGLEYQIGIGVVPVRKKLTLIGEWKISERLGLLFEMPYENQSVQGIAFGASCKLGKDNALDVKLKNSQGENLGIDIKLSKKILGGQGEEFIEALKEGKEISLLGGIGFRW